MATKIRLKRIGRRNRPFYRLIVIDSRKKRDGAAIEQVGWYNPIADENSYDIKGDRVLHWLGEGAIPSDAVKKIMRQEGLSLRWHLMQQGVDEKEIEKEMKKWELNRENVLADREAKKAEKLLKKKEASQAEAAPEAPAEEKAEEAPEAEAAPEAPAEEKAEEAPEAEAAEAPAEEKAEEAPEAEAAPEAPAEEKAEEAPEAEAAPEAPAEEKAEEAPEAEVASEAPAEETDNNTEEEE